MLAVGKVVQDAEIDRAKGYCDWDALDQQPSLGSVYVLKWTRQHIRSGRRLDVLQELVRGL